MATYTLTPNAVGRARRVVDVVESEPRLRISATQPLTGLQPPSQNINAPAPVSEFRGPTVGSWAPTGTASLVTAVNDSSDTTYARKTSTGSGDFYTWAMSTATIPADEVVVRFRWRVRMKRPLSSSGFAAAFFTNAVFPDTTGTPKDAAFGSQAATGAATTIAWVDGPWVAWPSPSVREMPQSQVDDLNLIITDTATTSAAASYFYEAQVVVETTKRPKVNITSQGQAYNVITKSLTSNVATLTTDVNHNIASGTSVTVEGVDATFNGTYTLTAVTANTLSYSKVAANVGSTATTGFVRAGFIVTDTTRPLLQWLISDAESDSQSGYDIFVYSEATVTAYGGGFYPGVRLTKWTGKTQVPTVWQYRSQDAGQVNNTPAAFIGETLSQGGQYRAYIRAYTHPGAIGTAPSATGGVASLWNHVAFTITAAAPPPAQVTVTPDTGLQANRVVGTARINLLSANQSTLDVDTTGWSATTNCAISRVTTPVKSGAGALALTSSAAGDMAASTSTVEVVEGQSYTATAQVRTAANGRSAKVSIDFYDAAGALLLAVEGTTSTDTTSYAARTVTGVAPFKTSSARVRVTFAATAAASEIHYVDEIALHPGTTAAYSPGGVQRAVVAVEAIGIGNLLPDPSLTTTSGTGAVVRSAIRSRSGTSFRVRAAGATTVSTPVGVSGVRAPAGATMTYGCQMTSETSTTLTVTLVPYDAAGTALATDSVSLAVTAGIMTQFSDTYTLPANTEFVALQFSTTVAFDFYVDNIFLSFGSTTPQDCGPTPPRRRVRYIPIDPSLGLFDYVDEGAPVDNVPTVYRFDTITDGGSNASGPVSAVATINSTPQWSLRVLGDPQRNVYGFTHLGDLEEDRDEQTATYWTLGSDYPTVLASALGGADGPLTIRCSTDLEWRQIRDVLASQSTIVLHPTYSTPPRGAEPKFIRITGQKWTTEKYGSRTYRTVDISYIETAPF